jgi:tight adherence protein C
MSLTLVIALFLMIFCCAFLLAMAALLRPSPGERRLLEVVESRADESTRGAAESTLKKILSLVRSLRTHLGLSADKKLRQRFVGAGLKGIHQADIYFTACILCSLAGVVSGTFIHQNPLFWCFALAVVGYLAPDLWLTKMVERRRKRIQRSIPDAIDLLVICVDAGLGLDQALLRVGQELAISYPELNEEFTMINLEQRAGKPRLDAWRSMAERTKVPEFAALVNMLIQTDRFGTPIIRALSRFSEEIRTKRRQRAEEAAAKTKIKILFPLVLFIFPCIFIVLLGPAVLHIAQTLATFK